MSWFEQSANQSESEKVILRMFVAVDFDMASGHARVWSGYGTITINGQTYFGAGELGKISAPLEKAGLDAVRKTYQLSGTAVSPMLISEADIDASFGREVVQYFGFINPADGTIVAQPEIEWEGRIDSINRMDGMEPAIEVNAEHRMVLLQQADGWRCTHEHQQQFYPGDNGYNQVAQSLTRELLWGGKRVQTGFARVDGGKVRVRKTYQDESQ